ncbi:MAG: M23 family metallopeptidase [Candidatus Edwardsbacteria bacterium]
MRNCFTFIFISPKSSRIRQVKFHRSFLYLFFLLFGLFLTGLGFLTSGYLSKIVNLARLKSLTVENHLLKQKISILQSRVDTLKVKMEEIFTFDTKVRILADLKPISNGIRKVGVGGSVPVQIMESGLSGTTAKPVEKVAQELEQLLRQTKLQKESFSEIVSTLEERKELWAHTPSIQPASGFIMSGFGFRRDPFTGEIRMHKGLDIAGPVGTPIVASADGIVTFVGLRSGFGLSLEINHGYSYRTFYAHLYKAKVSVGQKVKRGQIIALMGASGRVTGPHLHYEVSVYNKAVNPLNYILSAQMFD